MEHLTSPPKGGVASLVPRLLPVHWEEPGYEARGGHSFKTSTFRHTNHPRHLYNANNPTKMYMQWSQQRLWSQVLTAHSTERYCISFFVYSRLPCNNLQWSIAQSFLPQICIVLEDVLLRLNMCTLYLVMQNSLQGGHSFELTLTLYRNWTKNVGGKCSFTRVRYICHYDGSSQGSILTMPLSLPCLGHQWLPESI